MSSCISQTTPYLKDLGNDKTQTTELEEKNHFTIITEGERKTTLEEIICGKELKFDYVNGEKLMALFKSKGAKGLKYLDVLKYNYEQIFLQLSKYFPDIKINKFNCSPCINECANFDIDSTYKYDIYVVLAQGDKIFEYGFDFFESQDDCPQNKYEHSKILLDNYEYFYSEDVNTNDDIKHYLEETLFKLLVAICSIRDDEYKLAEILFVKTNKDSMEKKILLKELSYLTRVIGWKKLNLINLGDLFDNLMLIDKNKEEEITFKEFKKIIKTICEKYNVKFDIKQKEISYNIFEKIILHISTDYESEILDSYKDIYQCSMSMLMQSLKLIIQLTTEMNMRKKFISRYIQYLIEFKIKDYKNKDMFDDIYKKRINCKKHLFDKMMELINDYYDVNKHNEEKLEKIIDNFELLYNNMFDI